MSEEVVVGEEVKAPVVQMVSIDPKTLQVMADSIATAVVKQMMAQGAFVPQPTRPQGPTYLLPQAQGVVGTAFSNVNYVGNQVISGVEGVALTLTNIARGLVNLVTFQQTPTQIR